MHNEIALLAASQWAKEHAGLASDTVKFGHQVALVFLACQKTACHAGDEQATAAALASLSVQPEVLRLIEQLALLHLPRSVRSCQTDLAGAQ